jgi:hypothetical protein
MTNDENAGPPTGADDEPVLHGSFRDMAEKFMTLLQEDDEQMARLDEAEEAMRAEADQARAERARAGELGPEWRVVQGRIDLGQTSIEAVFSGEDTSLEAEKLRQLATRNLTALRDSWTEGEAAEAGEPSPSDVFEQTLRDSRVRFESAAQRIQDALRATDRTD